MEGAWKLDQTIYALVARSSCFSYIFPRRRKTLCHLDAASVLMQSSNASFFLVSVDSFCIHSKLRRKIRPQCREVYGLWTSIDRVAVWTDTIYKSSRLRSPIRLTVFM